MNYIHKILFAGLLLAVVSSCTGYLGVKPQGMVLPKTDEEFASIVHYNLRELEGGGDECIIGNMETIIRLEGCADDLDANIMTGTNLPVYAGALINKRQSDYSNTWKVIKDCNIVIENLKDRSTDMAKSACSAAYSMKALCYLNLIRDFCEPWSVADNASQLGLPIVDKFDIEAMPARASLRATVDYTLSLFDAALALHPSDPTYFFTEYVVKSYKARLLFWSCNWSGTASLCEDIMENSGLSLASAGEYESMFSSSTSKTSEVIARTHINNSSELDWYFTAISKYIVTRPASVSLVHLFGSETETDVRYHTSIDSRRFTRKFPEMRFRLSEILLMLAESYYHLDRHSDAISLVNLLRSKRLVSSTPLSLSSLPPLRSNDRIIQDAEGEPITPLLQLIFDERRKELCFEGDRWYELKRNGRPEWWVISNGLKYTTKRYLYTAPIFKGDVDLNNEMVQNPGY